MTVTLIFTPREIQEWRWWQSGHEGDPPEDFRVDEPLSEDERSMLCEDSYDVIGDYIYDAEIKIVSE